MSRQRSKKERGSTEWLCFVQSVYGQGNPFFLLSLYGICLLNPHPKKN